MHQMCEQLALLADLKRRNILIVDDALKLQKEMADFKVLINTYYTLEGFK